MSTFHTRARSLIRQGWLLPCFIGALVVIVWANANGWPDAITARDLNQHRANETVPRPNGDLVVEQQFVPLRDGLMQLELIFARKTLPPEQDEGSLTFALLHDEVVLASETLATRDIIHNQFYTFKFDPVENSTELPLTLRMTGENNEAVTVWGYGLDAIASGDLHVSNPDAANDAQDLRVVAQYQLTLTGALRVLQNQAQSYGYIVIVALLLLLMPGLLLSQLMRLRLGADAATHTATVLALGTASWPIAWFWVTLLGGRFGRISLMTLLIVGYVATVLLAWRNRRDWVVEREGEHFGRNFTTILLAAAPYLLTIAAFIPRMLAARDLTIPPWVDSSRHALMTAVMTDSGQFLRDYSPYLESGFGLYHYGYHAIAASLRLLNVGSLPDVLLITGQLINALLVLTVYAGGYLLTKRRTAALFAAFLIAFPFFFPGYYLSWGRLTQLTGMLLMPILLGLMWRLTQRQSGATRPLIVSLALLAAGLFFIHFRVFLVFLPLAGVLWLIWIRRVAWQLPLAGLLGGVLVLPRMLELLRRARGDTILTEGGTYNNFPTGYVTAGWEEYVLTVTAAALLLTLLVYAARYRPLHWLAALGLVAYVGANDWLGRPSALSVPWAATACALLLSALVLHGWRQQRVVWPLPLLLWLAFAPLADDWQQGIAGLLAACVLVWLAPQLEDSAETASSWPSIVLQLVLWVGILFASLLGERVGLPQSWVINLNSMYITLFMPVALVLGIVAAAIWRWLREQHWVAQLGGYMLSGGLVMVLFLYGAHSQTTILNQSTVLAEPPDLPAMAWIANNTPQDAKFAVSSWKWIGSIWAAQDGGAWIVPLTQRAATTPPADYTYSDSLGEEVIAFNVSAEKIDDWSTDEAIALLRAYDVSHVYVGARGGFLDPAELNRHPETALQYAQDGVFIFALQAPALNTPR